MDLPAREIHTIPEIIFDLYKESGITEDKHDVIGGVISDTKLSWLALGPYLQVFLTKTAEVKSVWCFGAVVKETNAKITCVEELKVPYHDVNLLVVGLKYGNHGGMICIYNLSCAKVIRAIEIPYEVTALHVINEGNNSTTFPGPLSALDGIISVGTSGGVVYIIDLCKERLSESKKLSNILDIRNETNPCQLRILTTSDVRELEFHKTQADQEGTHVAILLNEMEVSGKHFELRTPQGRNLILASKEEVQVSSLHYAPQLCSLFVGYNFGALQIWNFLKMRLEYTSPVYEEKIPVSHIAIQEPIDDPRAFCYFWAVYSCKEEYENVFPLAALYSLSYDFKDYHEGYGFIYRGLNSCAVRFQANLRIADTSHCKSAVGASCIRLQSYSKITHNTNNSHLSTLNFMTSIEDYTLCMMVWNVRCNQHKCHTYMSLFDLNQWYKQQMPDLPHQDSYRNYMSHLCLTDFNSSRDYAILDAFIEPSSIDPFIGAQKLEEHYWPSSLAYVITTLTEVEVCRETCLGSQRSFFKNLEESGPLALMHPEELYSQAKVLGLSPLFQDMPCDVNSQVKCEILLSIALERKMLKWLCKCATSWGNGSHRSAGLSLELLLNWGWERTKQLKTNADRYCSSLFDYSGVKLDNNLHALITSCRVQFGNLKDLFSFVVKNCETFLIHPDITRQQLIWLQKNYAYFNVIGWMINLNLLPETKETYPLEDIQTYYIQRRDYLRNLHQECNRNNVHKEDYLSNYLFIDELTDIPSLKQEWLEDGNVDYPPSTLQTLLRCYFNEKLDIKAAHSLVAYALLDLVKYCEKNENISATMIKFPQIFDLSLSATKAIQAFWQFDHSQLDDSISQLSSRMVQPNDLTFNQHQFIINLLKLQGQYKLALKYMKARNTKGSKQDIKHLIQLHVRNNMLFEGLSIERRHSDPELLHIFFLECLKADLLMKLVTFNFTKEEELQLLEFMNEYKFERREDFKTVYFVRRGRFLDFYMRHDKDATDKDALPAIVRNTLDSILPKVTKKVISTCMDLKGLTYNNPKSLAAFVCDPKERAKFNNDFVKACVVNCRDKWQGNEDLVQQDYPFLRQPITKQKPEPKNVVYTRRVNRIIPRIQPEIEDVEEAPPSKRLRLDTSIDLNKTTIETMHYSRISNLNSTNVNLVTMTPQSILKTHSCRGESSTPEYLDHFRRSLTPKLTPRPSISMPSVKFKVALEATNSTASLGNNTPKEDTSTSDYFTAESNNTHSLQDEKKGTDTTDNKRKRKLSNETKTDEQPSVLRSSSFCQGNLYANKFLESMRTSYVEEAVPHVNTHNSNLEFVCNPSFTTNKDNSGVFVFTGADEGHNLVPKARPTYHTHGKTPTDNLQSNDYESDIDKVKKSENSDRAKKSVEKEISYETKIITRSMTKEIVSKKDDLGVIEQETRTVQETKMTDLSWKEVTMEEENSSLRVVNYAQEEDMDVDLDSGNFQQKTTKELVSHFEEVHATNSDIESSIKNQNNSKSKVQGDCSNESVQKEKTPFSIRLLQSEGNYETPEDQKIINEQETLVLNTPSIFQVTTSDVKKSTKNEDKEPNRIVYDLTDSPQINFNKTGFVDYFADTYADTPEQKENPAISNLVQGKRVVFLDLELKTKNTEGQPEEKDKPSSTSSSRHVKLIKSQSEAEIESIPQTESKLPDKHDNKNNEEEELNYEFNSGDSSQESFKLVVDTSDTDDVPMSSTISSKLKGKQTLSATSVIEITDSPAINKSIFERSDFIDYFADSYVSPSDTMDEMTSNNVGNEEAVTASNSIEKDEEKEKDEEETNTNMIYEDLSNVDASQYTMDPVMNNYTGDQGNQGLVLNKGLQEEGTTHSEDMISEPPEELFETMEAIEEKTMEAIEEEDNQSFSENSEMNNAMVEVISISSSSSNRSSTSKSTNSDSSMSNRRSFNSDPAEVRFIEDLSVSDSHTEDYTESESDIGPSEIAFIADSNDEVKSETVTKSETDSKNSTLTEKTLQVSEEEEINPGEVAFIADSADSTLTKSEETNPGEVAFIADSTLPKSEETNPGEVAFIADSPLTKSAMISDNENVTETKEELKEPVNVEIDNKEKTEEIKEPEIVSEEVPTTPRRKRRSISRAESPALTIQLRSRRNSVTSEASTPVKITPKEEKEKKPVPRAVTRTRSMCSEVPTPSPPTPTKRQTRARSVDVSLPAIVEENKSGVDPSPGTDSEIMSLRRLTRKQKQMMDNAPKMDRLQLLDKGDFTGDHDPEEVNLLQRSPPSSIASSSTAENAKRHLEVSTDSPRRRGRPRKTPEKEIGEQLDRSSRAGSTESDRVLRRSVRKEMDVIKEEEIVTPKRVRRRSSVK